jgi:hypothetical protein
MKDTSLRGGERVYLGKIREDLYGGGTKALLNATAEFGVLELVRFLLLLLLAVGKALGVRESPVFMY